MSGDRHTPASGQQGDSPDARLARAAGRYAGVGLQFAASIIAFLYAGQWLDRRFGTAPWGVIGGVFLGASAAFYSIYRRLMADLRRHEAEQSGRNAHKGTRQ